MHVAARLEHSFHLFFKGVGGQRDDSHGSNPVLRLPGANEARRAVAVHHGHLHVHQNQVERIRLKLRQGLGPIFCDGDLMWRLAQIGENQVAVVREVICQENAQGPDFLAALCRSFQLRRRRGRLIFHGTTTTQHFQDRLDSHGFHQPIPQTILLTFTNVAWTMVGGEQHYGPFQYDRRFLEVLDHAETAVFGQATIEQNHVEGFTAC